MSVIRRLTPWLSSMADIHRWKSHPWMISTDDTFITNNFSQSMDDINMALSSKDEISPSMDRIFICQIFGKNFMKIQCPEAIFTWKYDTFNFLPNIWWIKNPSMDGKVSSVNVIHGWRNVIRGWKCHPKMSSMDDSSICGCHLRMISTDGGNWWQTWTVRKV